MVTSAYFNLLISAKETDSDSIRLASKPLSGSDLKLSPSFATFWLTVSAIESKVL